MLQTNSVRYLRHYISKECKTARQKYSFLISYHSFILFVSVHTLYFTVGVYVKVYYVYLGVIKWMVCNYSFCIPLFLKILSVCLFLICFCLPLNLSILCLSTGRLLLYQDHPVHKTKSRYHDSKSLDIFIIPQCFTFVSFYKKLGIQF